MLDAKTDKATVLSLAWYAAGTQLRSAIVILSCQRGPADLCNSAIIVLWIFAIFWHFTTGEWRQYLPTTKYLVAVIRYYAFGIFRGEAHPAKPTIHRKHNPLQRLSYLFLKLVINPAIWITGVLYLSVNLNGLPLTSVAWAHAVAAYAMAVFVVVHVYMATTGETVGAYLKAMTSGYEWIEKEQ